MIETAAVRRGREREGDVGRLGGGGCVRSNEVGRYQTRRVASRPRFGGYSQARISQLE
jgi:hypothetical protein